MISEIARKQRKVIFGRVGSRNARIQDFYFLSRESRLSVAEIFHRGANWMTQEGRKKQRRSSGTGWRRRGALSRKNGRRSEREWFDDSESKVWKKEPSERGMEWDGDERRAEWLQNRQKLHAALSRGTSSFGGVFRSASARRALTFARVGCGINIGCFRHSESISRSITTHSTLIYDADVISLLLARR